MKNRVLLCAIILILTAVMAGAWEGNAAVAPAGELPEDGFFVATNSFPRNTVVEVRNIENNRSVRVIVASGLSSQGLLALLSKTAASVIGISSSSVARIELIQPADPVGYSMFTQGRASNGDPDFDPRAHYFDESVLRDSRSGDRIVDLPDDYVPTPSTTPQQPPYQVTQAPPPVQPAPVVQPTQPAPPPAEVAKQPEPVQDFAQVETYNRLSDFEPGPDLVYADPTFRSASQTPADEVQPPAAIAAPASPRSAELEERFAQAERGTDSTSDDPAVAYVEPAYRDGSPAEQERLAAADPAGEEADTEEALATAERGPDYNDTDAAIAYVEPAFRPEDKLVQVESEPDFEAGSEEAVAYLEPDYSLLTPEVETGLADADEDSTVAYLEPSYRQPPVDPFYPGDDVILVMEPADLNPPESETYIDEIYVIRPLDTNTTQAEVVIAPPFLPPIPSLYPVPPVAEPTGPMVPPITAPAQIYLPPETPQQIYVPPTTAGAPTEAITPAAAAVNDLAKRFSVPVISELEKGKYYLQLGSFEAADAIEVELNRIGRNYPMVIQRTVRTEKPVYRILLGPLNVGESNAVLQRFKSAGYDDAFLRYN